MREDNNAWTIYINAMLQKDAQTLTEDLLDV